MSESTGKLVFANQLRGIAALSVALSHWGGVYVLMPLTVGWVTSSPNHDVGRPLITRLLLQWQWLNFGPLGVSVFFLISGFVIPFSLRSSTAKSFLVARFFRIFPLFWMALFMEWLIVFAQSHLYGRAMAFHPINYLYNALMVDDAMENGSVDLVHWSLIVEVQFYLVAAMLRVSILRGATLPLFAFAIASLCLSAAQHHGLVPVSNDLTCQPMFISFMFIGVIFNFHYVKMISLRKTIVSITALTCLFMACWKIGPRQDWFFVTPPNYLIGIGIFGSAYLGRRLFRPVRWLDFLADVSFPFYLIHSIFGFSIMNFAILRFAMSYWAAAAIALPIVLSTACVMHRAIETPSIRVGKLLAAQWTRKTSHILRVQPNIY